MGKKKCLKIKEVGKVFFSVLMSCMLSISAFAVDVSNWAEYQSAINGTDATINVNANITYGADTLYPIVRDLSIVGDVADRYLSGNDTYAGLVIDAGGTLELQNINMQNFKKEDGSKNGGAIENNGTITSTTGNFEHNSAATNGGAIYNTGRIGNTDGTGGINGNFNDNEAKNGSAIYNTGTITNIIGNFTSNTSTNNFGAIYNGNTGTIGNTDSTGGIKGNFKDNTGKTGSAIANAGVITNIIGNFTNNSASENGGAIVNSNTINKVTGNFTKNSAKNCGAVYNAKTINFVAENNKNITFSGNYVTDESGNGGAIFNRTTCTVGLYASAGHNITFVGGNETGKYDIDGIHNEGTLNINGDDTNTYAGTVNLYNVSDAETAKGTTNIYGGTVNVAKDITQNNINVSLGATLTSTTDDARIVANNTFVNDGTVNMSGDDSSLIANNLMNDSTITVSGANSLIKTDQITNNGIIDTVGLVGENLTNNGTVTTSGKIEAVIQNNANSSVTINGDEVKLIQLDNSGMVNFNGKLDAANSVIRLVENDGGIMNFSTSAIESTENLPINVFYLKGGLVNIADGNVNTLHINQLSLTGNADFAIDADLAAKNMDKISVSNVFDNSGTINISDIKLLSDATQENLSLDLFADDTTKDALKDKVTGNLSGIKYSPIYKYDALYNSETGKVDFTRKDFNPAILAGAVASQVGGYLNQLSSYDNAFEHMDTYMLTSKQQKIAKSMLNNMSASANNAVYSQPLSAESKGIWVKPYAVFEKVSLQGGPRVNNKMYGSFAGMDFDLVELRNDWNLMYSLYASYDGSHQDYDGVNIYQNGGHLGAAATWYKENFFVGLTANVGASAAEASTMYGTDNMTTLMTGAATKAGYNIELANPNFVIQPSLMMSYSFVNTFDYTNAVGVKIKSDPLHSVQIAPGVKFVGNLPHEWQPYIAAQMVWNIIDETKFTANNINLPGLSTKRYFQYGVGAQKRWGDSFSGYLQAMMRNEGRTGVAFSAGIRWAFGNN